MADNTDTPRPKARQPGDVLVCQMCGHEKPRTGHRQLFCTGCAKISRRSLRLARVDREKENARHRSAYASNPVLAERRRARWRKWAAANRSRLSANGKAWSAANPEKVRGYARARLRDASHRLHSNLRSAIYASLKGNKNASWPALVGYSLNDLKAHITRQFVKGMTWQNHGRGAGCWHIDHIIPKSSFRFESSDDPEFRACWALTNLRPLWAVENLSKRDRRTLLL